MSTNPKIIRQSRRIIGAPGKTDFIKIYICDDISAKEYDVLLKHEQSHIWCEHNKRYVKGMDGEIWNIACDVEIARNIYNDNDEEIINAPFSRIKGGVVKNTFPDMPVDLLLAEDIYEWLLENKKQSKDSSDIIDSLGNGSEEKIEQEDVKKIIEKAKETLDKSSLSRIADKNAKLEIKNIVSRKPSLTEELDAMLRYRVDRISSHRRPSRRSEELNILLKGKITKKNPPLVEVFVDRSGSFTANKTAKAQTKLDSILKKYGASIKYDVWFFGDGKISSVDFNGGDTPYHLIYEHLLATVPKIAVIITDDDPVSEHVKVIPEQRILCVPIGCEKTHISESIGGNDVEW